MAETSSVRKRKDALLHPIRARIIVSLGDKPQTPRELAASLKEAPLASLYRHLKILLEAELIEITRETRIHGTVERQFAVKKGADYFSDEERTQLTPAEILGLVRMLTSIVDEAFERFTATNNPPYESGLFSMLAQSMFLTEEEVQDLRSVMMEFVGRTRNNNSSDQKRRLIAFFSVPDPA